jgi:hypothetical protein
MDFGRITPRDDLGTQLVGRHAGAALREQIVREARIHPIIVDLAGITSISPSFADELFAKLPAELVEGRRVRFSNATDEIKALARGVRGLRRQLQHA